MEISVHIAEGLAREITITVPVETIEIEVNKQLQEAAKTAKIAGFRTGKIPANILNQHYGEAARYKALDKIVESTLYKALEQEKLIPAGQPKVDIVSFEPNKPLEYKATFEVYPKITLTHLDNVEIEQINSEIQESDLEKTIETFQQHQAEWNKVERPAKLKDQVIIDFEGFLDGKPFEGNSAKDIPLVLGSKQMIPGFEDSIVGFNPGEEKEIQVVFPADYFNKDLAGKNVTFKIKVHEVKESTLPELNEEFIKKLGIKDGSLETLKKELKQNMDQELDRAIKAKNKDAVMRKLLELNKIDIPKSLVEGEKDFLHAQAMERYKQYAKDQKLPEIPKDIFEKQAMRRVQLGLLVAQVIRDHDIKIDPERVKKIVEAMAGPQGDKEKFIAWIYGDQQRLGQIQQIAIEDQVVEKLLESATVIPKKVTFEEAMTPVPEEE